MKRDALFPPRRRNPRVNLSALQAKPAEDWENIGRRMCLRLFKETADTVPAYREFLRTNGVDAATVKNFAQFSELPTVTRTNYLRAYPYPDLFPNSCINCATTISATSGSTGEPFFFPRDERHDAQYERAAETFLVNQFNLGKCHTLGIIGFALGIWIGGVFTYKNLNALARKGYPLSLIPVGPNKELYIKAFEKFAPHFDQVVLMGYPPFIKDVLDYGASQGIEWGKHRLYILTAAEGYSEEFRHYISGLAGITDPISQIVNIYGTVEQGTIAHETAYANLIRSIAHENPQVFRTLFPAARNMPTLAQFFPDTIYFQETNGEVVATSHGSSIPLVRYRFADLGGVLSFDRMTARLRDCGVDIAAEAKQRGLDNRLLRLPFVYVHARADLAVIFYGATVFPGEIRAVLDSEPFSREVTGRFQMVRRETETFDQTLDVYVELRTVADDSEPLAERLTADILTSLCSKNFEFNNAHTSDRERCIPRVHLCERGDARYFGGGGKQVWVKND